MAENYLKEYIEYNYIESLNAAWESYLRLYRNIVDNFKKFEKMSLEYISTKLNNLENSNINLPGTYLPLSSDSDNGKGEKEENLIRIKKMGKVLKIFNTKQHPRQLSMIGTDDKEYLFLLKGHEDLHQDERAMQLFNLVNTILSNNKQTANKNLFIDTYSVFPLSYSTGIIGWVPNCDTLHQLIKEKREISKHDKDIYTYNNNATNNGIKYNQKNLRFNIKKQTRYAPIHIMKLESFFKKNQEGIIGLMDEEEENEDKNINNQTKNLTESLSKSQKYLLLASYLASEISTKNDKSLFKAQKSRSARKIHRRNNNVGLNLKSNVGYPFNVHRLTAIYQSLLSSSGQKFDGDDIMLKCEIATLAKLGLIRALSGFDSKAIDQKYFTGINLDFVSKIAEDYNISLEDYIKYEKVD